ncbi:hypothetical protein scyTo_0022504, partial [Scyliorhinus torazame]|nr:hypothetical protein [Scyliorhinus torazame]
IVGSGSIIGYAALQQLARHPEVRTRSKFPGSFKSLQFLSNQPESKESKLPLATTILPKECEIILAVQKVKSHGIRGELARWIQNWLGHRRQRIRPLFYLSLSDLMLAVCWLIGVLLYGEFFSAQRIACYNLQVIGQVLYMSSFCYTLNYTWCLYRDLRSRVHTIMNDTSCLITENSGVSRMVIISSR